MNIFIALTGMSNSVLEYVDQSYIMIKTKQKNVFYEQIELAPTHFRFEAGKSKSMCVVLPVYTNCYHHSETGSASTNDITIFSKNIQQTFFTTEEVRLCLLQSVSRI